MKNLTATSQITDLVATLMLCPTQFDMETIEVCTLAEMSRLGLVFRPYIDVLTDNDEGYKQTSFDTTEEYFFDAINAMNTTTSLINRLVNLCIA